jgi:hypothetical protein
MNSQQVETVESELEIEEEIGLHKKGWVVQRVGWVLLFAFILSAVLGLFGEGPLSKRVVNTGTIKTEYERFGRHEHETPIKFDSKSESISIVSVPQHYLNEFKLSKVVPEPESQSSSEGYINYTFKGEHNYNVTFYFDPLKFGNESGVIKVNSYSIPFNQTIYP